MKNDNQDHKTVIAERNKRKSDRKYKKAIGKNKKLGETLLTVMLKARHVRGIP